MVVSLSVKHLLIYAAYLGNLLLSMFNIYIVHMCFSTPAGLYRLWPLCSFKLLCRRFGVRELCSSKMFSDSCVIVHYLSKKKKRKLSY